MDYYIQYDHFKMQQRTMNNATLSVCEIPKLTQTRTKHTSSIPFR